MDESGKAGALLNNVSGARLGWLCRALLPPTSQCFSEAERPWGMKDRCTVELWWLQSRDRKGNWAINHTT